MSIESEAFLKVRRCAVRKCTTTVDRGHRLCPMHRERLAVRGDVNATPRPATEMTEELRAEIVRRIRRFESPTSVARALNIGRTTVQRVMAAERVA